MQPINPADLTWLNMDRPTNLMVVNGVMWFNEEPDWDAVRAVIKERLVDRFAVLRRRAVRADGVWMWEDDPDFDLDHHIRHDTLGGSADFEDAQEYVSGRMSQPLNRDHPLWEVDILTGLRGRKGQPKALLMSRFHHAVADGIRIVQLLLSLCDVTEDATPAQVGRGPSDQGTVGKALGMSKKLAGDVVDIVGGVGTTAVGAPSRILSLGRGAFEDGLDLSLTPTRLTDALTGITSDDNLLANTLRSTSRLALSGRRPDLTGEGPVGVEKRVSWVTGLEVAVIKEVGRVHKATVNDILVALVSRGLTQYVQEQDRRVVDASWLIPISLKPMDMNLPPELGNHFAMVVFPMPLGIEDWDELMTEVRSRMARIKNSPEAMMVYGVQRAIAEAPQTVGVGLTEFVANKTLGVLTNVPGPRSPVYLAGTQVAGILGWVPSAADQPMGICIFSYNGSVSMGIAADAQVMPDPGRLADLIREEYDELVSSSLPSD
ncbi:MAG: WS/DGAT domain-containing protein [Candidatus Nanopelagicales bacterium]